VSSPPPPADAPIPRQGISFVDDTVMNDAPQLARRHTPAPMNNNDYPDSDSESPDVDVSTPFFLSGQTHESLNGDSDGSSDSDGLH
jgi:hypothetical protein